MQNNHRPSLLDDLDLFVDSPPMNDEALSKLHESTLQMFRSNKIGPKNAFDIVLIDYLPAIFEATSFDDDHINNFQSVGNTLETSAKIYAARIDSLYSETRKAQSILRSTTNHPSFDDDEDEIGSNDESEAIAEKRVAPHKKIRLLVKRKKSVVTDRRKLLRKRSNDELMPMMMNQFFLSAMNNDTIMLSELYEKVNFLSTFNNSQEKNHNSIKPEQDDFACETLYIDTTNASTPLAEIDVSPSSTLDPTNISSQLFTPNSLPSSLNSSLSNTNLSNSNNTMRSRTNSISSSSSILVNAANLIADTPDEYSYLDPNKVDAFTNENSMAMPDLIPPISLLLRKQQTPKRKRRLSIEYPFPFLVEQAKKQRMTPKKIRDELLKQANLIDSILPSLDQLLLTTPLPSSIDDITPISSPFAIPQTPASPQTQASQRQRASDIRHLQTSMQATIVKELTGNVDLSFSDLYLHIHSSNTNSNSQSNEISVNFAALLNNAVRYQLTLETTDSHDDIRISSPSIHRS